MAEKNVILMLVYAKWCGHCVRYLNLQNDGSIGSNSKWIELCSELNNCEELRNNNVNLKTVHLEESQLKELAKLDKELTKSENSETDLRNMFNQLKQSSKISENIDFNEVSENVRGYPTVMALIKSDNGVFKAAKKEFNGDRSNAKDLIKYIKQCAGCDTTQEGGYKKKYKKYKKLYTSLLNKQKGGGDYENKYRKYKKLYLEAISKHK